MTRPIVLTGDRPSGPLHLGHYVGSLRNRLAMQSQYDTYIMIADAQALTDHYDAPDRVRHNVIEVAKDYLAVGLDPEQCTFFIQSAIPELAELAFYYMNLVTVSRLERNPTVKAEIQQKGMGDSVTAGFLCYPISQAADITAFGQAGGPVHVPVGDDQIPMIEQTNEIVRKFNRIYGDNIMQEAQIHLSNTPRLMGIDGQSKASKSLNNAISLGDSETVLKDKIFAMYTDPNHIHVNDPGNVDGHMVFHYLDAFDPDTDDVQALKDHYRRGGLGDMVLKKRLFQVLNTVLTPIRTRRNALTTDHVMALLRAGTEKARIRVQHKVHQVRQAMALNYFDSV